MSGLKKMIFSVFKSLSAGFVISFGFILLDGFGLNLLSVLRISYGAARSQLATLIFIRGVILIAWCVLVLFLHFSRSSSNAKVNLWVLTGINAILLSLLIYGFFIEPARLTTTRLQVKIPDLTHPIRIVQLSDIHIEHTTRLDEALPNLVESLDPDMIVMTGDYLNENFLDDPISRQDFRDLLNHLSAPLGIFAVSGNVDTPTLMQDLFIDSNVRVLSNELIEIHHSGDRLLILGVDYTNPKHDEIVLRRLMREAQPADDTLLLYHSPDLAYVAQDLEIDLYLTGHQHGGQIRIPFYGAIVTNSKFGKAFEMGTYHLGDTVLFVSRGLGFAGGHAPRIRFLAPPEIVVIDLIPK